MTSADHQDATVTVRSMYRDTKRKNKPLVAVVEFVGGPPKWPASVVWNATPVRMTPLTRQDQDEERTDG